MLAAQVGVGILTGLLGIGVGLGARGLRIGVGIVAGLRAVGVGLGMGALVVFVGLAMRMVGVLVGLGDQCVILALAFLGQLLSLGLALVDILIMQLHGQGEHCRGAFGLVAAACSGAGDLLQGAGFGARLDLGQLFAQLFFALLGFLKLLGEIPGLSLKLLALGLKLLVVGLELLQLAAQLFALGAELIALLLDRCDLLGHGVLIAGSLCRLCGELVDLGVQLIDLALQLLIAGGKRAVRLFGFGELCGGLVQPGGQNIVVVVGGRSRSDALQFGILVLQLLHLCSKIGDLRVQRRDFRAKSLGGLAASDSLLTKSLNGLGDLIKELVDLVSVIPFLEAHELETMFPDVLRRQQNHKITPRFKAVYASVTLITFSTLPRNTVSCGQNGDYSSLFGLS